MDNGEVIVALNEDWSFAGATLPEWMSGFITFILASELTEKVSRSMPLLMLLWLATTFLLASLRKSFPDEDRGLRNFITTLMGFPPPGLPAASKLQPVWSGSPIRGLSERKQYEVLQLDQVILDVDSPVEAPSFTPRVVRQ
ncbi:MAG: hypothetical protein H6619_06840 [Deltaproteobacteria bacterium]|nr:hypothetical protein [Deltaproteobacteria bacterium]